MNQNRTFKLLYIHDIVSDIALIVTGIYWMITQNPDPVIYAGIEKAAVEVPGLLYLKGNEIKNFVKNIPYKLKIR